MSITKKIKIDLSWVHLYAIQKLEQYNLYSDDWRFEWKDEPKTYLGVCNYKWKTIGLNRRWMEQLPREEIIDTVLHEVAHAIVGRSEGHSKVWKQKCIELGCRPQARSNFDFGGMEKNLEVYKKLGIKKFIPRYKTTCPTCGDVGHLIRKRSYSCGKCSPKSYNEKHKLIIEKI